MKVVYREFTNDQFSQQKLRTAAEQHLGIVGPMLHAEVGDTIEVVFKNNANRNYSVHPHGLYYRYIGNIIIFAQKWYSKHSHIRT